MLRVAGGRTSPKRTRRPPGDHGKSVNKVDEFETQRRRLEAVGSTDYNIVKKYLSDETPETYHIDSRTLGDVGIKNNSLVRLPLFIRSLSIFSATTI